jgi:Flp pilus assembly protein TadG
MTCLSGRRRLGAGSLTAELVVIAPVIAFLGLVSLGFGRYEIARQQAIDAARAGAEAASIALTTDEARTSAEAAARPALAGHSSTCPEPDIETSTPALTPGSVVRVTVTCNVPLAELAVPGLPGAVAVSVTESAPIDGYRSVQ